MAFSVVAQRSEKELFLDFNGSITIYSSLLFRSPITCYTNVCMYVYERMRNKNKKSTCSTPSQFELFQFHVHTLILCFNVISWRIRGKEEEKQNFKFECTKFHFMLISLLKVILSFLYWFLLRFPNVIEFEVFVLFQIPKIEALQSYSHFESECWTHFRF